VDESKVQTETDNADDDQSSFADGVADTVYVEGLPYDTSEDLIRNFFKDCGKIISIRAPKYQDTGRLRSEIVFCVIRVIPYILYTSMPVQTFQFEIPC
jgi:RNA recognition motif-containing protein